LDLRAERLAKQFIIGGLIHEILKSAIELIGIFTDKL